MLYLKICIFIDDLAFDINMRPGYGNTHVLGIAPITRGEYHSIIGAARLVT